MSIEKPLTKPASKILPQFASQIDGWIFSLEARFLNVLERVSAELEGGVTYHAPHKVSVLVANFIGGIKSSDCCATGNVVVFNQLANELKIELNKLRYVEAPPQRASA